MRASCSLPNSREQDAPTTFNNYSFHLRWGLFIKGLDTIFFIIALKSAQKFGVFLAISHLGSLSVHLHGQ
jgi:hypothetical protein